MSTADIIITIILTVIVIVIVAVLIRNKKKGKGSCSCGCSGCQNPYCTQSQTPSDPSKDDPTDTAS